MNKSKDRLGKFTNLSLRIKLPGLITLLVIASVLAISVSVYSLGSELLLKKSKDEITANADRIGEGLWTAVQLQEGGFLSDFIAGIVPRAVESAGGGNVVRN